MAPGFERGLVEVYTGNGKGKSTAAFGLALRAAGHGMRVQIVQFMKSGKNYGEITSFQRLQPEVSVRSFGRPGFISRGGAKPEDYTLAREALDFARKVMLEDRVDLLILDEINNALYFELLEVKDVLELLEAKPSHVEVVLTGRNAPAEVIEQADLVTEVLEIKHPYQQGISSRKGIEY